MSENEAIDPLRFRETLGHYPTGVVLVTGIADDGQPVGMVVGSFTSVSLSPPLIAFLPMRGSQTFARLRTATSFCVNVLAAPQEDLCRTFARKGGDKFAGVDWVPSPSGAPILSGVVAWIDCRFDSVTDGGDHYIVLGRVRDLGVVNPVAPLLFFQGGYGRFAPLSLMAHQSGSDLITAVRLAEIAREDMEALAASLRAECTAMAAVGDDLVLIASAAGPEISARSMLGTRIPLMPPLGELYVAWEGQEVAERWLARAATMDEVTRAQYVNRLTAARRRGWSISFSGQDRDFHNVLRDYASGTLTPAQERELKAAIASTARYYEPIEIVPGARYDVFSLVAPVFGADGHVQLVLRLSQLPPGATTEQITGWVDALLATAASVTGRLAGKIPAGSEARLALFQSA